MTCRVSRVVGCVVSVILATFLLSCTNSATLSSIQVSPTADTTTAGTNVQFTAMGLYTKSSHPTQTQNITDSVTWASSSPAVATINSTGLATPLSAGTTTITATMSASFGPVVGTATLTVASGTGTGLISISILPGNPSIPQVGPPTQLTALAVYSPPQSNNNITSSATWASSSPAVATVIATGSSAGLVTAVSCGTTTIQAEYQGVIGQTVLTVSCTESPVLQSISLYPGSPSIPQLGQTAQFIALGAYSPASSNNVLTSVATWASSNVAIATVSSTGLATAVACGTTTITAEYQGVIGQTQLTVSCTVPPIPVLQSITLYPGSPSIPQIGQNTQFIALAIYSPASSNNDLTSVATWASSNVAIATVNTDGLATAVGCGTTTITAEYQGIVGQTPLTVQCTGNQTLQSISILPSSPTIPQIGQTTKFVALGTLVQGGEVDLTNTATWSSSNTQVATVSNTGTATAVSCGTTTVSAESQNIVGTAVLTVSCGAITSIELLVVKTGSVSNTTVTSAPAGISCGTLCGALFNEGTGITLTAAPAPTSWTGCDQVFPDPTVGPMCFFTLRPDIQGGTQKVVTTNF